MPATGQYFDPTIPQTYPSYQSIRYLHPNISLPRNKDMPSLNLYQIFTSPVPEYDPETEYPSLKQYPVINEELGIYEQAWEILPIPDPVEPPIEE